MLDFLVLIYFGCGVWAMWIKDKNEHDDGAVVAIGLFLFGALSLFVANTLSKGRKPEIAEISITRIFLTILYGLAVLQWTLGLDELW